MDMMNSIAAMGMSMSAAQFQQQYSISVQKKAMDMEEMAVQEILQMMPDIPKGQHIDFFA